MRERSGPGWIGVTLAFGALAVAGRVLAREGRPAAIRHRRGDRPGEPQTAPGRTADADASSGGSAIDGHGRDATSPAGFGRRGWRDVLLRSWSEMNDDNLSLIAAGVAFYTLLGMVPGLAALVSVYGLFADPGDVQRFIDDLRIFLAPEIIKLLSDMLHNVAANSNATLGLSFAISLGLALWSAKAGAGAMMIALNVAYDEREKRGWFHSTLTALGITAGGVLFLITALVLIAFIPIFLKLFPFLPDSTRNLLAYGRWPLLALMLMVALSALYRLAPSRERAQWTWVSWGAVIATVAWMAMSVGFSLYVSNWGSYDKTYGSLGAVVVLLMWFYLSTLIVLLGAELNAEMEHQTAIDTTTGTPMPMGLRNAEMADTLGKAM